MAFIKSSRTSSDKKNRLKFGSAKNISRLKLHLQKFSHLLCVCVCVRARARARARACVRACVRACARARACVCVCGGVINFATECHFFNAQK